MKLNWNFWGDRGCKTKNLPWGENGYFLELHITYFITTSSKRISSYVQHLFLSISSLFFVCFLFLVLELKVI